MAACCLVALALLVWLSIGGSNAEDQAPSNPDVERGASDSRENDAELSGVAAGPETRLSVGVPEPDAPPVAAEREPARLEIAAIGPGGDRRRATVCAEDDAGSRLLGTTAPAGSLEVSTAELSFPVRLTATADDGELLAGYVVLDRSPPSGFVEVDLADTCVLSGAVVDSEGLPLPGGVRVIALDPLRRLSWLDDVLAGETPPLDGRWASTLTDGTGRFRLRGLLPGRSYGLYAAGAGFATSDELDPRRYACGEETIVLTASPLFAGIVRVGTERTDELVREVSEVLFGPVRVAKFPAGSLPLDIARTPALAGTTIGEEARTAQAEGRRVLAFTAPGDVASLNMKAQVKVPFLPPDWHEIGVPRLESSLADIPIDVAEPTGVLGSLEVLALAVPGIADRLAPDSKIGELRLRRDGDETVVVVVRARSLLAGFSIPGLPLGVYEWSLRFPGGSRLLPRDGEPAAYVEVGESAASLLLDLTWTSAVELTIRDREGVLVTGPLRATVSARTGTENLDEEGATQRVTYREVASMVWTRRPYIAPFVPPGEYYVGCTADFARRLNIRYKGPFEFQPDSVSSIELRSSK